MASEAPFSGARSPNTCAAVVSRTSPTPMCTGPTSAPVSIAPRRKTKPSGSATRGCQRPTHFNAAATARTKSTMRGPQREATESSTRTIARSRTAEMFRQPGRALTVLAFCPQHLPSASTITDGFAARMYSAESCG